MKSHLYVFTLICGLFTYVPVTAQMQSELPVSWAAMLNDKRVQDDLEMTSEQRETYKNRIGEFLAKTKDIREQILTLVHEGEQPQQVDKLTNELASAEESFFKSVGNEVLLPFQVERLNKLAFRKLAESLQSYEEFLNSFAIKNKLGIKKEQSKAIKDLDKKYQPEFEKELNKLIEKYQNKLNQALTSKQRDELNDLLGDTSRLGKSIRY